MLMESGRNIPAQSGKSPSSRRTALQSIVEQLCQNHGAEAIQLFAAAVTDGTVPAGVKLQRWLTGQIGRQATAKLIHAYAKQPCFGCNRGLETCESCEGQGRWKDGTICDRCIGMGLEHCGFCNGTGLITYNAIPADLRISAMFDRVDRAVRRLRALLELPLPDIGRNSPQDVLRQSTQTSPDLDRWLGVLENALLLAKEEVEARPGARAELVDIMRTTLQTAAAGTLRMREIIKCMAHSAESGPQITQPGGPRGLDMRKAALFKSRLESSRGFAGTALDRPFLSKALNRVLRRQSQQSKGTTRPARQTLSSG